jgi:predicted N-acetyltransferase YhbS
MNLRPLHDHDLEAVLSMWNRSAMHDRLTPELMDEKIFDDPAYQPQLNFVAEREQRIIGFVSGTTRQDASGVIGFVKLLVVDPAHRRQRLGTRLVDAIETELRGQGAYLMRVFDSAPNYLQPGIDPRYTELVVFFERRGYERFQETANMEVDLHERDFDTQTAEAELRRQGFDVRRAIMGDRDETFEFVQRHWAAWIPEVERALMNYPISLHLALQQDQIVAFSAYDGNNLNTGWFGPMGTDPAYRGHGLGGVLLQRCLADIKAQGHRLAIIPWVGPHGFYLHYAGARIARVFWRYRKKL